ncbi:MAG: ion channel [Chitinophagaceae bacterium]
MALLKRINNRAKTDENTGFGTNSNMYGGRFFNKNGTPDLLKTGIPWLERNSWYHTLLQMNRWQFLLTIFITYVAINLFFAIIYLLVGIDKLAGMIAESPLEKFGEAFFFSAQTFTTVGYGRLAPTGFMMSFISSTEALIGLLSFAVATGLLYGRFSRPQAFLKFSHQALVAPYKETIAIMFRMTPFKNNHLTEAEVKLSLALMVDLGGKMTNQFYPLKLELEKINAMSLSWTVVHVVDEDSPFYGLSKEELITGRAELLVFVKAFDDMFSNTVVARSSYTAHEMVFGAKFSPMYHRDERRGKTVLEIDKLDDHEPSDISFTGMMKVG